MDEPLLEATDLTVRYRTNEGDVTAVSDASFRIGSGNYFGLVGESGCGKSTIARALMHGLPDNGFISSGEVTYKGRPIHDMSQEEFNQEIRWKEISWIPQSSMSSLDPLQRISEQVIEIADIHTDWTKAETKERLRDLFDVVGLQPERITDYPHQFSGGMQQRAIIAIALLLDSSLIIADEPTTALDVIMQDQVFKYFDEVKEEMNTSLLLITHDISVVFESCDDMSIMHGGQVAESGSVTDLFDNPRHPYTILLQEAFPDHRYPDQELHGIDGTPPRTFGDIEYCTFVDRCPWAVDDCSQSAPPLEPVEVGETADSHHSAACFRKTEVLEQYRDENEGDALDFSSTTSKGQME
jgi:oligopeptide/dipeptide ABC transporter ATP-binding protein